jgi:hypothetical protein
MDATRPCLRKKVRDMRIGPPMEGAQNSQTSETAPLDGGARNTIARAQMGEVLRQHIEEVIARYVAKMRADPETPRAKLTPTAILEDHALSFLSDLFQSVVIIEKSDLKDWEESDLLKDGTRIQLLIADLHGRQRQRIGWTQTALRREYEILDSEVERLVKGRANDADAARALEPTLEILRKLLKRAHDASFKAFETAAREKVSSS